MMLDFAKITPEQWGTVCKTLTPDDTAYEEAKAENPEMFKFFIENYQFAKLRGDYQTADRCCAAWVTWQALRRIQQDQELERLLQL